MGAIIGALVQSILGALFAALRGRRQDEDRVATHERAAAAEAAAETQQTIAEIADARSSLPPAPDDPDALAGELRRRKTASGRGGADGAGATDGGGAAG